MPNQTVTRATESDCEPATLYTILAQPSNIPKWAPVFVDTVEPIDASHFQGTKNGKAFPVELFLHPAACAVDYILDMAGNRRGGAYIRVTPRPLGGSTVTMTVPLGPDANEFAVAKVLEEELAALVLLARP
jgi:hypothetical protein